MPTNLIRVLLYEKGWLHVLQDTKIIIIIIIAHIITGYHFIIDDLLTSSTFGTFDKTLLNIPSEHLKNIEQSENGHYIISLLRLGSLHDLLSCG